MLLPERNSSCYCYYFINQIEINNYMKIIQSLRSRFASTPKLYEGLTKYIDISQLTRYVQLLV